VKKLQASYDVSERWACSALTKRRGGGKVMSGIFAIQSRFDVSILAVNTRQINERRNICPERNLSG
jgi:hypothetical protein